MTPLVSIACTTFNHAQYITQCLDGFLMQKTSFNIEIVIHDDASTDGTKEIIERYTALYPDIFYPLIQEENQYSKGIRGMMSRFNFPRCRGKYIALCEGDDYWTDPYKLQKQVDFLEQHPSFSFSMGKVNFLYQDEAKILPKKEFVDPSKRELYTLTDYLKQPFSQTSTFVFRNLKIEIPSWTTEIISGDQSLVIIYVGKTGKIKFHDEVFSVYRINKTSVMQRNISKVLKNNFKALHVWNQYLDYEFNALIKSRIIENYLVYILFYPKFMQQFYKNYKVEMALHFCYSGILKAKNFLF